MLRVKCNICNRLIDSKKAVVLLQNQYLLQVMQSGEEDKESAIAQSTKKTHQT